MHAEARSWFLAIDILFVNLMRCHMKSLLSKQLRIWATLGLSLTCLLGMPATHAAEAEKESTDIVYTQSNIANANENTILGFYREKNGPTR